MFILISGAPTAEQHPKSLPFYSKSDDLLKTYNHKMPALLIFHLCAPHHTHSTIMLSSCSTSYTFHDHESICAIRRICPTSSSRVSTPSGISSPDCLSRSARIVTCGTSSRYSFNSVSYTHLDVYKRQHLIQTSLNS